VIDVVRRCLICTIRFAGSRGKGSGNKDVGTVTDKLLVIRLSLPLVSYFALFWEPCGVVSLTRRPRQPIESDGPHLEADVVHFISWPSTVEPLR